MKKAVLKEFQCFLFLRAGETKSLEMTWRWSWRIDGTAWNPIWKEEEEEVLLLFVGVCFEMSLSANSFISLRMGRW